MAKRERARAASPARPLPGVAGAGNGAAREPAIRVAGVSKSFPLQQPHRSALHTHLLHRSWARPPETVEAVRNVSFEIPRGQFVGVVGRNGSGKSTLLRCLAGIYPVDRGTVRVAGRVAPFIELGVGFQPDLSARENLVSSAVLLGLDRRDARARVPHMLEFADLERFADQPVRNFSSGMHARLSFAVIAEVDADVLLFDEVFAVGDEAFHQKCRDHFARLRSAGKTVVLVTHDMRLVEAECERALILDRGDLVGDGDPATVAALYRRLNLDDGLSIGVRRGSGSQAEAPAPRSEPRPHLLGAERERFVHIVRSLVSTDLKARYAETRLSYLWTAVRPLAQFGILLMIFTALGRFRDQIHDYPAYLLTAIVLWGFFAQGTNASVPALTGRSALLRQLPFPNLAAPLAAIAGALVDLLGNLVVALVLSVALGIRARGGWLELPLLLAVIVVLTTGVGLLCSALYVRFRDVSQIWSLALQTLFWCTPIFYVATSLPRPYDRAIVLANPLAAVFTEMRHALVDPTAPSAATVAGGGAFLLVPLATCLLVLAAGLLVFRHESDRAAERV